MVTPFDTINQEASVEEAINLILKGKVRKTGHKTISLIVVDDYGQMTGVITMYDILYHLRPDFLNFGLNADEFPWTGQLNKCIDAIKVNNGYLRYSTLIMLNSIKYDNYRFTVSSGFRTP